MFFKEEFERQANYELEGDKVTALKECLVKKADKERYLTDSWTNLDVEYGDATTLATECTSHTLVNIGATYIPYKHHQRLHLHPLVLVTGCQIKSPRVQPILRTWGHFGTPCSYVFYFLMGQD